MYKSFLIEAFLLTVLSIINCLKRKNLATEYLYCHPIIGSYSLIKPDPLCFNDPSRTNRLLYFHWII